jgi:hypothetical protein
VEAETLARRVADEHGLSDDMTALGMALAVVGEFSNAVTLIDRYAEAHRRDVLLYRVIEHMASAERYADAAALLDRLEDPYWAARGRLLLTDDEVDVGELEQLCDAATLSSLEAAEAGVAELLIGYDPARTADEYALSAVAQLTATRGNFDEAQRIADCIPHPGARAKTLYELTLRAAASGQRRRAAEFAALAFALSEPDSDGKYPLHRVHLAELWAAAGEARLAQETAEENTGPLGAAALAAAARWMPAAAASRMVIRALAVPGGRWIAALEAVARCAPDAIRALVRDLAPELAHV